jgi:hypothetical protein
MGDCMAGPGWERVTSTIAPITSTIRKTINSFLFITHVSSSWVSNCPLPMAGSE